MSENDQPVVRQASVADIELLVPLFDAYRQFYRQPSNTDLARQFLRDRLVLNQSIVWLALEGPMSAVGFTQLFPSFRPFQRLQVSSSTICS